jgi:hypothetical protein
VGKKGHLGQGRLKEEEEGRQVAFLRSGNLDKIPFQLFIQLLFSIASATCVVYLFGHVK